MKMKVKLGKNKKAKKVLYLSNFIKLKKKSILYKHYLCVDSLQGEFKGLLQKNGVSVAFLRKYTKKDEKFHVLWCRVYRWEEDKFLKSVKELYFVHNEKYGEGYKNFCKKLLYELAMLKKVIKGSGKSLSDLLSAT